MTITVLLMSILTGQNHTVVAEYDTPQACEAAAPGSTSEADTRGKMKHAPATSILR